MSNITTRILWVLLGLLLVALLGGALFFTFFLSPDQSATSSTTNSTIAPAIATISSAMKTGNFTAAVANNQAVQNDPSASAEEKAMALTASEGAQYYLSGNINDLLQDIGSLKQVVLDTSLSLQTRVAALNALALSYPDASGDQAVTDELYKDPPFSTYLVPDQPTLSARQLYDWSYNLLPTPEAAIHIAKWYGDQYVSHPYLSTSTTQTYIAAAEENLNNAESGALARAQTDPSYTGSDQYYVDYQFWKAIVIGRLAAQNVPPYTTEYQSEFDQYINFAKQSPNIHAKALIPYAEFNYAQDLSAADPTDAKAELDVLASDLNTLPVATSTVGFVRLIRNTYIYPHSDQPTGSTWANIVELEAISPNFKSAINRIIANVATSSTTAQ